MAVLVAMAAAVAVKAVTQVIFPIRDSEVFMAVMVAPAAKAVLAALVETDASSSITKAVKKC